MHIYAYFRHISSKFEDDISCLFYKYSLYFYIFWHIWCIFIADYGSPVGEVRKTLSVGHRLKVISRIQEKTVARNFCSFSSEALQPL